MRVKRKKTGLSTLTYINRSGLGGGRTFKLIFNGKYWVDYTSKFWLTDQSLKDIREYERTHLANW